MSHQFRGDCGRCGTKGVSFFVNHSSPILQWDNLNADVFAQCGICGRGVVANYYDSRGGRFKHYEHIQNYRPYKLTPQAASTSAPPHTPTNCGKFYKQAMSSLNSGDYDAAGAMFRKTLETGLKSKFSSKKRKLIDQIQEAANSGLLTEDLAKWAHHIRQVGNKAAHDEHFSKAEASELKVFTELVLRYFFELPGKLEEARQPKEEPK